MRMLSSLCRPIIASTVIMTVVCGTVVTASAQEDFSHQVPPEFQGCDARSNQVIRRC